MLVKPIEAPTVCPRDALLQGFEGELLQQGYAPSTVRKQKRLFADLSDWLQTQELTAGDLSFRLVDRFLRDSRSAGFARHKTHRTLRPILDYLHRLKIAPPLEAPVCEGLKRDSGPVPALFDHGAFLDSHYGRAVCRSSAPISG